MKTLFAINTSHGILGLKAGYVTIAKGGYAKISEDDTQHPDFKDAFAKDWVRYSVTEPNAATLPPATPEVALSDTQDGMSEEELKAELAKDKTPVTPEVPSLETEPEQEVKPVKQSKKSAEKPAE